MCQQEKQVQETTQSPFNLLPPSKNKFDYHGGRAQWAAGHRDGEWET